MESKCYRQKFQEYQQHGLHKQKELVFLFYTTATNTTLDNSCRIV